MINVGVVGVGKMGGSHLSMINAHPQVRVAGVCDSTGYVLDVLGKYTGLPTFADYSAMLAQPDLNAVIISTPTQSHASMINEAFNRGLDVFCEKPLCLDPRDSRQLADRALAEGFVTQVGYHNRYVGAFREVRRLLDEQAIGEVTHVLAEAYGPVVLKEKGVTWRSRRTEGGGCLYDYAAHPIDLVNWFLGMPTGVGGTSLGSVFSRETEDEVFATMFHGGGATSQLSVSWSDESQRKMTTRLTLWGKKGRIFADRQECQVYFRDTATPPSGYHPGWNVRYTTDLTEPVWFYLRGEEYSAQLDDFFQRVQQRRLNGVNTFASAAATDEVISMLVQDAAKGPSTSQRVVPPASVPSKRRGTRWWRRWRRRT